MIAITLTVVMIALLADHGSEDGGCPAAGPNGAPGYSLQGGAVGGGCSGLG